MDTDGSVHTKTLASPAFAETHPAWLVPVIEYTELATGVTTALPLLKVYVAAPPGFSVYAFPEHIEPLLTDITGNANTVTFDTTVFGEAQPWRLYPVTE